MTIVTYNVQYWSGSRGVWVEVVQQRDLSVAMRSYRNSIKEFPHLNHRIVQTTASVIQHHEGEHL